MTRDVQPGTGHGSRDLSGVEKVPTGIPGFDEIALGGLPRERTTVVTGSAGTGKTIFAAQFLAAAIEAEGTPAVFVTFEESPAEIIRNLEGFGWDLAEWIDAGLWAFVDGSPEPHAEELVAGPYDLEGLLIRVEHAIEKVGARRVAVDSASAVFARYPDEGTIRRDVFRLGRRLVAMGATTVITAERAPGADEISRHGIEEFIADNVVVLRMRRLDAQRQRTIEILKMRGAPHQSGETAFTIRSGRGIVSVPLSGIGLDQPSGDKRIPSGVPGLDEICGGGILQSSTALVVGSTGTGKSLMAAHFLSGSEEERALFIATEESRQQIFRNTRGWGIDLEGMEASGRLRIVCDYPESGSLEHHLIGIKDQIEEFRPRRLVVDSLTALERIASTASFREFVVSLTAFVKRAQVAAMLTSTTAVRLGRGIVDEAAISTATDSIFILQYVEEESRIERGLLVLKMRGSEHSSHLHRYRIDDSGMKVGAPFEQVHGMLREDVRSRE